ncbi:MAG: molybdopterin-dependent oxidoreductase [Gammaproteobacteria bacterium]|nr:molybdopterin-dependent oxidoreductase [Gammaproteobacteria bacterium]NNJ79585.1 molybdopterin-dependent oxidoreductase [Xanthomonadales bacterium]
MAFGIPFVSKLMASAPVRTAANRLKGDERMVRVGCPSHNCGGRCLLRVYVKDGLIRRIETDDRPGDTVADPQLRACMRGRSYRHRQHHADRLKYPLKRTGERGSGAFERISWNEATDLVASEITRVRERYGNTSLYVPYGTGSYNQVGGKWSADRLMNLCGGALGYYNSYSWACITPATATVYGTDVTGNQRQDWLNSRYILMWGWNPSEMRDGTNSEYILKEARRRGARVVCIDPRMTLSAVAHADEWIAIRPGTDVAMMSAMAWVMITEGLYDRAFVERCCIGFDAGQMPAGQEDQESYRDYILGTRDGQPKTPEWAERITSVPRQTIARIAREYAAAEAAVLYQGYGMQRRAYGEQVVRAGCVLAAISGNVGKPGGWASGIALQKGGGPFWNIFPTGENPVKAQIPTFLWTEAVLRGPELTEKDGLVGIDRLPHGIKLMWAVASNAVVNQHANVNRTVEIVKDTSKLEFFVAQDNFMTPTARFADLVLPACTQFETWGLEDGWKYGEELILQPQILDPPWETKSDYAICAAVADKLGVGEAFTQGRDEKQWIGHLLDEYRELRFPDLPTLEEFEAQNLGVYSRAVTQPKIAFADFRDDPEKHPLDTPSGKIEIYSQQMADRQLPETVPPIPKYIEEWESPFGESAEQYPLQVIGTHFMPRVHSTFANVDWNREAFPQRVFINPIDAEHRGIEDGQSVRVFNDRGTLILPCRVTRRILPGVVNIPQGAWWKPDGDGNDVGGCVNTLTSERWTPFAFGNAQHTIMAEVALAETVP